MKLFQQKTSIHYFDSAAEFAAAFPITESDFILASKTSFDTYFAPLNLKAHVEYKSKYGQGEPTDAMIDQLLADFRQSNCTRIIAIGGGAVIDMAKILQLGGNASAREYFEKKVELTHQVPLIAIPTTCGAGSEVSNVSITEITALHTKLGLAVDELYAEYAILIPELLGHLPYDFFVTSAIDALIHAIESYVSPRATLYTEMFSEKAIQMIIKGFQRISKEGPEIRMDMLDDFLVASNLAGIAFGNAGTGAVHAMSYPLSGKYHVTHGEANYQFFTEVFKEYQRCNPEGKLKHMNQMLAGIFQCQESEVYDKAEELLGQIMEKKPLHGYGMKEEEIESFADSVLATQQRLLGQSYVQFSKEQMMKIYGALY